MEILLGMEPQAAPARERELSGFHCEFKIFHLQDTLSDLLAAWVLENILLMFI